jgi:type I site-specific restriction endonuclease
MSPWPAKEQLADEREEEYWARQSEVWISKEEWEILMKRRNSSSTGIDIPDAAEGRRWEDGG